MNDADLASFEHYLKHQKPRQPSTVRAYSKAVQRFGTWLDSKSSAVERAEAADITEFLAAIGATPRYRNFVLGALRIWYDYLMDTGQTCCSPARELKRNALPTKQEIDELEDGLSEDDLRRLHEAVIRYSRPFERSRNRAILSLFVDVGLTTQELCGLKDADLTDHGELTFVHLHGVKGKGRIVMLEGEALDGLRAWLDERKPIEKSVDVLHAQFSFWELEGALDLRGVVVKRPPQGVLWPVPVGRKHGWPLTDQGLRAMLRRFGRLAKIDKRVTPRLLRRAFAERAGQPSALEPKP